MSRDEDEFLGQLRATFRIEAEEHLQTITAGLLELEKAPASGGQRELVATVFRAAHSLKGAARAVDFSGIESSCQSLEDTFAAWKREEGVPSPSAFDVAHRALDAIGAAIAASEGPGGTGAHVAERVRAAPAPAAEVAPTAPVAEHRAPSSEGTVRVTIAKLDARLLEAEEMLAAKLAVGQRAEDLRELGGRFETWRAAWAAVEPEARLLRQALDRPGSGRVDAPPGPGLARLLEFLDWNRDHLGSLEHGVATLTRAAEQDRHVIGMLVDDLLADSKRLLLLPFATVTASFPKLVRDLSRDLGKEADLVIRGGNVEIDKRILEEMKDPLVHLLRNCVDHGVEKPEARACLGKPARATITLAVSAVDDSKVEILVSDDGAGIDAEGVKASAVKHGFISAADARRLDDAEARALAFHADVSTSSIITRLSGRGLGLAIVREQAEKLGGTVSVESEPGRGTRMRVELPSMLATFRGVLVEAAGQAFVAPTAHVERVARARTDDVKAVEGRETIALGGRAVSLVRLADVLKLPSPAGAGDASAAWPVLVLGQGDQPVAFRVDVVLDEQEVLVKPLRSPLARVRNIAGATVLGSGRVALILNVPDLLKSAHRTAGGAARVTAAATPARARAVLVAEDSITSRMLLKSMLESAGYKVRTAVDGMEALTLLRAEPFDLLVSDVEMPRLDGFELTARIRGDERLAELPVVLVTARETRDDRERGIDVGANAYIVKSSLDQESLLEAIRRLV